MDKFVNFFHVGSYDWRRWVYCSQDVWWFLVLIYVSFVWVCRVVKYGKFHRTLVIFGDQGWLLELLCMYPLACTRHDIRMIYIAFISFMSVMVNVFSNSLVLILSHHSMAFIWAIFFIRDSFYCITQSMSDAFSFRTFYVLVLSFCFWGIPLYLCHCIILDGRSL